MIERGHALPLTRQAEVLKLSRSSLYYRPRPVSAADLAVMRRIDELHLDYPFAGSGMLRDLLRGEGVAIGRQRVATMMKRMGIQALYRRPNTSKPAPGHKIYPYLLRGVAVGRPNQVWRWTSPTCPWRAASSISPPWSTGSAAGSWLGGSRSPWRSRSVSRRSRKRWQRMAGRRSSTPTRACPGEGRGQPVHQRRLHRAATGEGNRDQHGRQGIVAGQRLRGTALALGQIRGGLLLGNSGDTILN